MCDRLLGTLKKRAKRNEACAFGATSAQLGYAECLERGYAGWVVNGGLSGYNDAVRFRDMTEKLKLRRENPLRKMEKNTWSESKLSYGLGLL